MGTRKDLTSTTGVATIDSTMTRTQVWYEVALVVAALAIGLNVGAWAAKAQAPPRLSLGEPQFEPQFEPGGALEIVIGARTWAAITPEGDVVCYGPGMKVESCDCTKMLIAYMIAIEHR